MVLSFEDFRGKTVIELTVSAEIGASPLRTRLRTVLETFVLTRLKTYFKLENLDARMYLLVTRYVQMLKVVYVV